jgi:hypothetical protein
MAEKRNDRDTRNLDPTELAKLARESVEAVEAVDETEVRESRAPTLQDPLTAALLAEVARNCQTQDFDPADILKEPAEPLAHPNLKRRQ